MKDAPGPSVSEEIADIFRNYNIYICVCLCVFITVAKYA